jgi:hypothetical protein
MMPMRPCKKCGKEFLAINQNRRKCGDCIADSRSRRERRKEDKRAAEERHAAWNTQQKAQEAHCAALLSQHGFWGALRHIADGLDIGRAEQITILAWFDRRARQHRESIEKAKLAKLEALANDVRGNPHERAIAKAKADKLKSNHAN